MSTLGGYESGAGLNDHEAHAPTRIPLPSLLRSLLSEHLDPGYAAAAAAREAGDRPRRVRDFGWLLVGAGAIATVFAVAAGQAQTAAPAAREAQHIMAGRVRAAQIGADTASAQRDALVNQVDAERRSLLGRDENGQLLLGSLDTANIEAAAIPLIGPGLTVTVTDPGLSKDLSDVSKQRVAGGQQIILDRDLQLVVNSLWASGAEAVSVGGVRVGAGVTIRQAGGGILVDNQPITSPYAIVAIGPPKGMADAFDRTPGLQRMRLLETSYGVGVNVSAGDGLTVPAVSVRDVNFAKKIG
ncbi:DUF881 domain-containing protein [Mycolicibacterium alvei]|jgi:uncharacterized protein YlxW (UPF0749 family)|uniref:Uncharacterized protein n=1 Tax=Mycolicibacterium alvei TaxID=67081 RepID=A0A6N4UNN0_9MYCO|nr:DUF881 domain-containing protein [Mycolicibacterium alvei]MCV7000640.1 DUF881 domain-containing protein [Mycolicibacterium alvei]BBX25473.1 hypothetical protein MALV_05980 [Mycolicibacterium alvei]